MVYGKSTVCNAVGSLRRAMKYTALENLSTMVNITELPQAHGCLLTKYKAMWNHGQHGTVGDEADQLVVDGLSYCECTQCRQTQKLGCLHP